MVCKPFNQIINQLACYKMGQGYTKSESGIHTQKFGPHVCRMAYCKGQRSHWSIASTCSVRSLLLVLCQE